jgi:glycerol-3-phosphate acyltransferase PlsY
VDATIYTAIIALIISYLLGSFPAAYLMGRFRKGIDIREVGSRNMGAMNVIYNVGIAEGILVLFIDAIKGAAAVFLARQLGLPLEIQLAAGAVAVIGHAFPVFLKFHGGRGGATVVGVVVFLMPWTLAVGLPLFGLIMLITRFPTFSYGIALCCCPFVAWLIYHSAEYAIFSIILLLIPTIRYIPRIKEMRSTGGSWRRVTFRRNLKDRF